MRKLRELYDENHLKLILELYAVYLLGFFLLEKRDVNYNIIHSSLDDKIPFVKSAILVYCAWFLILVIPFVYLLRKKSYDDLWNVVIPMFMAMFISLIIYIFWPTALDIRPKSIEGNDLCAWILRRIQSIDAPNNVCPSIHVSTSVIIDHQFRRTSLMREKKIGKVCFCILNIGICISTMLVKQHSIIDVISGVFLAYIIVFLFNKINR